METDPPRVSSTGMCGDLRLSTTVIKRLDLAKADSHTGGMMLSFSNRARSRMACLAVVITALLCAAYPPKAVGTTQEDRWQWPTGAPVPVVEGFSPPAHDWLPGRRGVTLRYPAPSAVYACAPGTVTVAGPVAGRGVISIHHSVRGRDVWSTYLPVTPTVTVGDHVEKGDVIGVVEADSQTLHWGVKTGRRTYIDPIRLTIGRPRLLPWDEASAQ